MTKLPTPTRWPHRSRRTAAVWATVAALVALAQPTEAQQTVGGTVVEATTRSPLEGARVLVDGTVRGTLTDNRGHFVLTGVAGPSVNLRVTKIGFRELRQSVPTGRADLVLVLDQTAVSLDATIVTGTPDAV